MQDPPTSALIRALAQQGDESQPRSKFEARLIGAALELVERAERLAPASDVAERERLAALLGESGDLSELNRRLCERIRSGEMVLDNPALSIHVRATTMEKLAIDQPTYAAYQRALEQTRD